MAIPRKDEYGIPGDVFIPKPVITPIASAPVINPVTTGFVRNAAAEAAAIAAGVATKAEIEARGGINVSGYYGDSYNPQTSLTDAEYAAALAKGGGAAVNAALEAKMAKNFPSGGSATGGAATPGSPAAGGPNLEAQAASRSAYALLLSEFSRYGLEALVSPLQDLIKQGLSGPEFQIALRNTDAYQKRFAGNTERIKKGLTALSPAEYLALEDQYQNIMRNYGLPADYYAKDSLGTQQGFNKLIANDVSAVELEERVLTAQRRVLDAPPEVKSALKQFYPDITNSDILAYTLDPEKGLADIKKKVTAAEIGGAAIGAGLATDVARAEELAKFGVTAEKARQGYQAAVPIIERGSQLSEFYKESPYTQRTAEEEIFGLTYAPEATAKRKRLTELEQAAFAGKAGTTAGALGRERAGSF